MPDASEPEDHEGETQAPTAARKTKASVAKTGGSTNDEYTLVCFSDVVYLLAIYHVGAGRIIDCLHRYL